MKEPFAPSPSDSGEAGKKAKKSLRSVRPDPFALSESEMLSQLPQAIGPSLFLDHFTFDEVSAQIESTSFLSAMKQKGVLIPRLELGLVDPDEHRLIVFDDSEHEPLKMIELRFVLMRMEVPPLARSSTQTSLFEMLAINWVMMQNPRAVFTEDRPRLPGQEYPGLGLGRKCQEFLVQLAARLRRDGLVNHPQYFHNAIFYRDEYYFLDPRRQGKLLAMFRDLARYPIGVASQAIADGRLMDVQQQIRVEWNPEGMVCPIHKPLDDYFQSREYREVVQRTLSSSSYDLAL